MTEQIQIDERLKQTMQDHLAFLYGEERGARCYAQLEALLTDFKQRNPTLGVAGSAADRLTERDALLITYGDQVSEPGNPPLRTLHAVLTRYLHGTINGVHILPFYPYTSDDGFSVVDYTQIDPQLGSWQDVEAIGQDFRVMFDAVVNHISSQSAWFQGFLRGDPRYRDYFVVVEPGTDVTSVTRPRTHPLLTPFQTAEGQKLVWTTFSDDQIDLNVANEAVMLKLIEVLLLYVERGADLIRLDAIGYLWKTIGTKCIHLEETHRAVQLWRAALDAVAPSTLLVTETNVPHLDNISYFGDGSNEAQMVYQFPLAPLTLNAFHTGNAAHLRGWAAGLEAMGPTTTFFNFLASHDGIGVMPAVGILSAEEIAALVTRTRQHGGYVSYKNNADGSQSPYELNITFFDALSDPAANEPADLQVDRFMSAHAIMLALAGVPGVYIHSLVGSPSYHAGVTLTGRYRTVNRQKWTLSELERLLSDSTATAHSVFWRFSALLEARARTRAFHPNSPQQILDLGDGLFSLLRTTSDGSQRVLCLQSVAPESQPLKLNLAALGFTGASTHDLVTGNLITLPADGQLELRLQPYQVLWLSQVDR